MSKSKKELTIYDMAQILKVSPSTVSRALKGHFSIGKRTTQAVKELAAELNYQPNSIASSLRKNETHTIGVIISKIDRPFISSAISGIEQVVSKAGYNVIITQSNDSYSKEIENANALYSSRVDGLIVSLGMESQKYDHFLPFQKSEIPLVFFDRVSDEMEVDKVTIDNFAAAFKATEHLLSIGCKRIAHFAGSPHRNIYKNRRDGYLKALEINNICFEEELIIYSNLSHTDGIKSIEKLLNLSEPPDGIFSANDTAAVSAIQYIKRVGFNIPDDIAVVGFNNDPISSIIEPSLTTIEQPAFHMGELAAKQVLKQMGNINVLAWETITLKTKLIQRDSTTKKDSQLI
jgi:LacI family transcriptional regulator